MSTRSEACAIPRIVKEQVNERDGGRCIFCGRAGLPEAHIIPRSHGGLGNQYNIVTVCRPCHDAMDNGRYRREFLAAAKQYIAQHYGAFDESKCVYRRNDE